MNLGELETFEVWVLRYGAFALYSSGHGTAESARAHAVAGGWSADYIEVVRERIDRVRIGEKK